RGDTGWAVARMTALRLDATDRHHRLASDVDHVATQREGKQRGFRETELAGANEHDIVLHPRLCELAIDPVDGLLERKCDVIREDERCGARAAFTTVNGD